MFVTFGEAMLRLSPVNDGPAMYGRGNPSARAAFMRAVGGDELNVSVALSKLGRDTQWVSVLPFGPLGDVVRHCAEDAGIDMQYSLVDEAEGAEMGFFNVLPDQQRVWYQRKYSSFALAKGPGYYPWKDVFAGRNPKPDSPFPLWFHCTGITPLVSESAYSNWNESLQYARALNIPISFDLNHRPALGTLETLWGYVSPHIASFQLVVLAQSNLQPLIKLMALESDLAAEAAAAGIDLSEDDKSVLMMKCIHRGLAGPIIACCFKIRDTVQQRWSVMVDGAGIHSTHQVPVFHLPKDECGGGSAWSAAVIDALNSTAVLLQPSPTGIVAACFGDSKLGGTPVHSLIDVARRGDVLAALCQEEVGDHCTTTRSEFNAVLVSHAGQPVYIGNAADFLPRPRLGSSDAASVEPASPGLASVKSHMSPIVPPRPLVIAESTDSRLNVVRTGLKSAAVIGILRTNNRDVAFARGVELAKLGCKALEVTADSDDFPNLLRDLRAAVGDTCLVGAGTLMSAHDVEVAAAAGAQFAISPIHPDDGFVSSCHAHGMLAVPAAFTPQEIYRAVSAGAKMVKLFPAQMWSPANLKALKQIGSFGDVDIMPSGGISADTVATWLSAGAAVVGMGSCLVGDDVRLTDPTPDKLAAATAKWESSGRVEAAALFQRLGSLRS